MPPEIDNSLMAGYISALGETKWFCPLNADEYYTAFFPQLNFRIIGLGTTITF
jgi:hypothetical protein